MARILVVDDEIEVRDLIFMVLAEAGHQLDGAGNGMSALSLAREKRPSIIILDRNMPGMSGLETLAAIRRDPALKGVKVLMCTASEMVSDVDSALAAGADDYIVKPLDLARLREKVARLSPPSSGGPQAGQGGLMAVLRRFLRPRP